MSHPLAPALERAMIVDADRIVAAVKSVIAGKPPVSNHWHAGVGLKADTPAALPASPAASSSAPRARPGAPSGGEPITMPFGDLTVSEGKVVRWAKAPGDAVKAGELVAEIETDKAVVEIEAPIDGRLGPIEQEVGAVVPMGGRIGAVIRTN
jgi:2-oxoisovalerate dehydrogenase E1 component